MQTGGDDSGEDFETDEPWGHLPSLADTQGDNTPTLQQRPQNGVDLDKHLIRVAKEPKGEGGLISAKEAIEQGETGGRYLLSLHTRPFAINKETSSYKLENLTQLQEVEVELPATVASFATGLVRDRRLPKRASS